MKDFHVYSPTDIIDANLREIAERFSDLFEQEWAHLCELAEEIAHTEAITELFDSLPDYRPPTAESAIAAPMKGLLATVQSVRLCKALANRIDFPIDAFFADTEAEASDTARIIYQKSSYTDEAFLLFSTLLQNPQASYAHSFHASCEAVYNGEYDYCILPVENSAEGELSTFSRLIDRYGLKIAASCEIVGNATSRATRFTLLRRKMLPLISSPGSPCYFECTLPQGSRPNVTDLLSAAEMCGLQLYRINSLPTDAASTFSAHPIFLTDHAELRAFLLYLTMEAPHYTPIGLYPHVTKKG